MVTTRKTINRLAPWLSGCRPEFPCVGNSFIPAHLEAIAEDFVRAGVLTKSPHLGKPLLPQDIQRPTESMRSPAKSPGLWSTLLLAHARMRSTAWASERLARHSLISTIQVIRERRAAFALSPLELDVTRASFIVEAYRRCHVLFSRPRACLYDSLSLLHLLSTFNIFPSLVFGIIPEPFSAHCWLQHRSTVINDRLSLVSRYTPIMLI